MDCKTISKNLVAFLDGELDNNLAVQIKQHLANCPACNKKAGLLSKTWGFLDGFPELEPKDNAIIEIKERLKEAVEEKTPLLTGRWQKIAVLATAAALLISFVLYFVITGLNPITNQNTQIVANGNAKEELKIKVAYYEELLANLNEVKLEYYYSEDGLQALSPYLVSEEWDY